MHEPLYAYQKTLPELRQAARVGTACIVLQLLSVFPTPSQLQGSDLIAAQARPRSPVAHSFLSCWMRSLRARS
jgi:hypothetical protein